ncbi:hypothetical protein SAMN04488570_0050 [Nocardioides scoriae]|uniref:Uncharacterized protein n=1 Tax=Nocardioides scoriae TaxID=642780 RepID=A0A1H1L550_9ACTN|nr:hypothetical protein [Nocardioides scoriae]SDR69704.1 hypothetical protein SAMN04488570_0050 [Nocardioides scoriae]
MAPTDADELAALAEPLYAGTVADFVTTRDALAKQATASGDKPLAAAVKKLRKPSVAAWAVNLLVRREHEQIEQVLGLAESLRAAAAALDGDELRQLTRQRRQLTSALTTTARARARQAGTRLSEPVAEQVEGVLTAAMLDPVAAEVVLTGRVVSAFTSTGVDDLDVAAVVAVPDALGVRAEPAPDDGEGEDDAVPGPPALRVVVDEGARLAAAQEALEEADEAVRAAEAEHAEVEESVQALDARRLQLQGEAEELRRRLAEIEERADQVDEDHEEAQEALADADGVLREARESQARARRAVEDLERDR